MDIHFVEFPIVPKGDKPVYVFTDKNRILRGSYIFGIIKHSEDKDFEKWGYVFTTDELFLDGENILGWRYV